ncbi:hypothetical protein [Spiroplasma tabanidicola]|uniref:Uncharacterized protein n=1 Tax=Spiroplasma tabanidicola TaxID=324079 RepID=A0A6I6C578_9MOLU|nr:hypothetical protein [Spiroplasma tabanidicola]QGS51997.1 hypothetical protein STABA_v1c06360 [Spiroplasma tabanidicola]
MNKIYYKSKIWYCYLFLALFFLSFLIWGVYECCFHEYWYYDQPKSRNFEDLMSYMSVHVNIMTIVWLFFQIFSYNKKPVGVTSEGFKFSLMNWNMIVFLVFWAGIIYSLVSEENMLSAYSKSQIACTIVTHFICPLILFIIFPITSCKQKLSYIKWIKQRDIYISCLYPVCYLFYIYIRGLIYLQDDIHLWPYEFLDFEKEDLFLTNSVPLYIFIVIVVFGTWIVLQHLLLISVNNLGFYLKNKYRDRYEEFTKKISTKVKNLTKSKSAKKRQEM